MIQKIVSGGQTGADRMALDWRFWHDHSAWRLVPQGTKAEDGPIEAEDVLIETPCQSPTSRSPESGPRGSRRVRPGMVDPGIDGLEMRAG